MEKKPAATKPIEPPSPILEVAEAIESKIIPSIGSPEQNIPLSSDAPTVETNASKTVCQTCGYEARHDHLGIRICPIESAKCPNLK